MITVKSPLERIGWCAWIAADSRLANPAKITAHSFALHCNKNTGRCYISNNTICKETGLSRPSVIAGKTELEDSGYLIIHREKDGDVNKVNHYTLVIKDIDYLVNNINHPSQKLLLDLVNNIDPNKVVNEQGNITRRFKPPTLKQFQAFCNENSFGHIAEKAYKYYSKGNWKDKNGVKVKNWKNKLIAVWFDEGKNPPPQSYQPPPTTIPESF